MESYILPNFPREFSSIHLCLFQNVTNSASLRTRLVEAATMQGEQGDAARDEMDYGFVEASMIVSREHIVMAVYQALQAASTGTLKTRTVHSEVLLALHPSNNIADAIKRFGISGTTKTLLLVRIGSPSPTCDQPSVDPSQEVVDAYQQSLVDQMAELVDGELVSLQQLSQTTDWKAIKKLYKLHEISLRGTSEADDQRVLEANMLNTLSTKVVA
ncbi:hypothetical protein QFC22_000718 [Naganishia vaughanmartiniae]|uniref:Uncharacterized protein n=1 Tax=Naganishia vaughanmartiniae TaxID=1424756 RepID=A0ACC2XKX8_9TREE|nr:hypothetical protein QFC22_000718 [Naganishia vaughanmartiniae]